MAKRRGTHFCIEDAKNGEFYVRIRAGNNKILFTSGETYKAIASAQKAIRALNTAYAAICLAYTKGEEGVKWCALPVVDNTKKKVKR